jgi:hypothetical protein
VTEHLVRWSTVVAVAAVAIVAGWVSYEHALAVVRAHGETGAVARVYPATVDGLIYSASMVLLDAARRRVSAPRLARWLLAAGIGATLAANVAAGLHFGPVGAVVAAWPALALVGSYELLMLIIRAGAAPGIPSLDDAAETVAADVPADVPSAVPGDVPVVEPVAVTASTVSPAPATVPRTVSAMRARGRARKQSPEHVFSAEIERGELPSLREIKAKLHVGTDRARVIRGQLSEILQEAPEAA